MSDDIERMEISIEVAEKAVAFGDKVKRLISNKDYQEVIDDGYLRDEASRLTSLIGDKNPHLDQEGIIADLHAIASFRRYIKQQLDVREMLLKEIADHKEAIDYARQEQE